LLFDIDFGNIKYILSEVTYVDFNFLLLIDLLVINKSISLFNNALSKLDESYLVKLSSKLG